MGWMSDVELACGPAPMYRVLWSNPTCRIQSQSNPMRWCDLGAKLSRVPMSLEIWGGEQWHC